MYGMIGVEGNPTPAPEVRMSDHKVKRERQSNWEFEMGPGLGCALILLVLAITFFLICFGLYLLK